MRSAEMYIERYIDGGKDCGPYTKYPWRRDGDIWVQKTHHGDNILVIQTYTLNNLEEE